MTRPVLRALLSCWLASVFLASPAFAHELRPGYLELTETAGPEDAGTAYRIVWKQPVVQNKPLAIEPVLASGCARTDVAPPKVTGVAIVHHWQVDCDLAETAIRIDGLNVTHTDVLVRLQTLDGESASYVLRPVQPILDLKEGGAPTLAYFVIGVEHLVFGVDHVLFVIGLFLFIRAPIALIKTITAFTVSHSITLALSVMELVKLDQGPIEVVIALSILFLARELVQDESKRSRLTLGRPWVMAFIFGLLHGLGFAGALADIGLPEDDLWLSLLLFNLGIEAGQIAVICLLAAITWALRRINWQQYFDKTAAWGMGYVAAYWTVDRIARLLL